MHFEKTGLPNLICGLFFFSSSSFLFRAAGLKPVGQMNSIHKGLYQYLTDVVLSAAVLASIRGSWILLIETCLFIIRKSVFYSGHFVSYF